MPFLSLLFALSITYSGCLPAARVLAYFSSPAQVEALDRVAQSVPPASETYDQLMSAGYQAAEQRDYQQALQKFQQALALRPNDFYAQQAVRNVERYLENARESRSQERFFLGWFKWMAIATGTGGIILVFWLLRHPFPALKRQSASSQPTQPEDTSGWKSADTSLASPAEAVQLKAYLEERPSRPAASLKSAQVPKRLSPRPQSSAATVSPISAQRQEPRRMPSAAQWSERDFMSELIEDLQEPEAKRRQRAILELAQRGDSRAIKPLVELMINADSYERNLIFEALTQISARTVQPMYQALTVALENENADVRKNAIRDLAYVCSLMQQASQLLYHAADDSDAGVSAVARQALAQFNLTQISLL